jgi:structure-specific endonuclease subunit SLX1
MMTTNAFKSSYVYFLIATNGNTYIGATNNLKRRLRQHNCEIKGGARSTRSKVAAGEIWKRICYVTGFPDWSAALQFEWRWKQLGRKSLKTIGHNRITPLERRMQSLKELLALPQSTTKAVPYKDWKTPPQIHIES